VAARQVEREGLARVRVQQLEVAPACIGSSGLPGVGIVKLALDRKLSFSRPLERTLRMSRVPERLISCSHGRGRHEEYRGYQQ